MNKRNTLDMSDEAVRGRAEVMRRLQENRRKVRTLMDEIAELMTDAAVLTADCVEEESDSLWFNTVNGISTNMSAAGLGIAAIRRKLDAEWGFDKIGSC